MFLIDRARPCTAVVCQSQLSCEVRGVMVIGSRLPALLLALLPIIHGAAVLDLINLFHQYEDDILGRGQGVNPGPQETYEEEVEAGKPIEVHGWDDGLKLGQVSAVDVDVNDDPVIFQRGPVVWDAKSFNSENVLNKR